MPIERLSISGMEQTPSGKGYKYATSEGNIWSFDPKTNRDLMEHVGGGLIDVSVDRTPQTDRVSGEVKVFPKITACHGVAGDSSPPPATPSSPAAAPVAPASPGGAQAAPGAAAPPRNRGFTKDPLSNVVIARQVAFKASVDLAHAGQGTDPEAVILERAERFTEWLLQGLSEFVAVDGLKTAHIMPWKKAERKAENAAARAELPPAVNAAEAAAAEFDDGIPF